MKYNFALLQKSPHDVVSKVMNFEQKEDLNVYFGGKWKYPCFPKADCNISVTPKPNKSEYNCIKNGINAWANEGSVYFLLESYTIKTLQNAPVHMLGVQRYNLQQNTDNCAGFIQC